MPVLFAPVATVAQSLSVPSSPSPSPSPNVLNRLLPLDVAYHTPFLLTPGRLAPNTGLFEVSVRTQGPLLGTHLAGHGALSYVGPDEGHVDQTRDSRHQAVRLGLRGVEGPLQYGVGYRAAGAAAAQDPAQTTHSIWMNWATNQAILSAAIEERTSNIDRNPSRPIATQLQKRLGIDLHAANRPVVRLSYLQQQTVERLLTSVGGAGLSQDFDTVEGGIEYRLWGLALQANSQYTTAHLPESPQALHQQHRLAGRLSPLSGLTFESGLSVTADQDRLTHQWRDTSAAQVAPRIPVGGTFQPASPNHLQSNSNAVRVRSERAQRDHAVGLADLTAWTSGHGPIDSNQLPQSNEHVPGQPCGRRFCCDDPVECCRLIMGRRFVEPDVVESATLIAGELDGSPNLGPYGRRVICQTAGQAVCDNALAPQTVMICTWPEKRRHG